MIMLLRGKAVDCNEPIEGKGDAVGGGGETREPSVEGHQVAPNNLNYYWVVLKFLL